MLYNIFNKSNFYKYLSIKFNSRQEIYRSNLLTAFIFSIGIVVFINIICILLGCFMSFSNKWSAYSIYVMLGEGDLLYSSEVIKLIMEKLTPLSLLLITELLIILYLLFISLFFIVCNIIFRKTALSFISVIVLNGLNITFHTGALSEFSFVNNVYILNSSISDVTNGTYIISRLFYWFILVILMYFIGDILTKKKDCNYGE